MSLQGSVSGAIRGVAPIIVVLAGASCGSTAPQAKADGGDDASGSAVDPDGGDASAPATASAFCEQVRVLDGRYGARCYGGSEEDWRMVNETYTSCADFDRLVAGGTVRYHPERAAACLSAHSADRACFSLDSPCYLETVEGTLAVNAPCRDDYECPANAVCVSAAGSADLVINACLPSICVAFANKVGDSCAALSFCLGALTCVQGICVADLAQDQPCGSDRPACRPGLQCSAASGTCVPRVENGACLNDQDCVPTHFCGGGQCMPRLGVAISCNPATECGAFSACNAATLICEAAGHLGQPCALADGGQLFCLAGRCIEDDAGNSICRPRGAIGAVCATGDDCLSRGCANGSCADCTN